MRFLSIAIAAAWSTVCASTAAADPYQLLAPDDPSFRSGWRLPPSPTSDLKAYSPVDAKNWLEPNGSGGAETMHGAPGQSGHSDMKGMDGMDGMDGMEPGK